MVFDCNVFWKRNQILSLLIYLSKISQFQLRNQRNFRKKVDSMKLLPEFVECIFDESADKFQLEFQNIVIKSNVFNKVLALIFPRDTLTEVLTYVDSSQKTKNYINQPLTKHLQI